MGDEEQPKRGGWAAALLAESDSDDDVDGAPAGGEASAPSTALAVPVATAPVPAAASGTAPAPAATMPAPGMPTMPTPPDPAAIQMFVQQVVMTMAIMQAMKEGPSVADIPSNIPLIGGALMSNAGKAQGSSVSVSIANLEKAKQYQRLAGKSKDNNGLTVFLGGLRKTTDEDQVFSHFSRYGEVEQVDIKRQPNGDSRGFAFVRFANEETLERVMEKKAQHIIDNKWIDVKRRDNIAANAGRAASLAKANEDAVSRHQPREEPEEKVPNEEEFTSKYLALSQQVGQRQEQEAAIEQMKSQGMVPMMAMPMVSMGCMGKGMMGGGMMMMGGGKGKGGNTKKNGRPGPYK